MRLIKLIVPAVLIAVLALFAPHADAQTMGEYAPVTAGVGTAGGSMGASSSPSIGSNDTGGGSSTWGASGLGGSWSDRAGAASASGMGMDFESRAGSSASGPTGESRWRTSSLEAGSSTRSGGSSNRFADQDRFTGHSELSSSSDRFPANSFGNRPGSIAATTRLTISGYHCGSISFARRGCDADAPCSRPARRRRSCRPSRTPAHPLEVLATAACSS